MSLFTFKMQIHDEIGYNDWTTIPAFNGARDLTFLLPQSCSIALDLTNHFSKVTIYCLMALQAERLSAILIVIENDPS